MIFLLATFMFILAFMSIGINNNSLLSTSLFTSISFLISAIVYCVSLGIIGSDISIKTLIVITSAVIFMIFGEFVGKTAAIPSIRFKLGTETQDRIRGAYYLSHKKIIYFFLLEMIVFVIRFYDLFKFSRTLGNSSILRTIGAVRLAYATGEYVSSGIIIRIAIFATIIIEFVAYAYLYFYFYNRILRNIKDSFLIIPFIGYMIILLSVTGRTQYISSIMMVITMMIYLNEVKNENRGIGKKTLHNIAKIGFVGIIALFAYGSLSRNGDSGNSLLSSINAYLGASLYGLDITMGKTLYGIDGTEISFGYYTLQNLHSFLNDFGFSFKIPSFHHLPFFSYANGSSNIYTSLLYPILDYGVLGMFVTRFLIGVFCGRVERNIKLKDVNDSSIITCIVFMNILMYNGISASLADRYYDNLLSPYTLIKYTIVSSIIIKMVVKSNHESYKEINE